MIRFRFLKRMVWMGALSASVHVCAAQNTVPAISMDDLDNPTKIALIDYKPIPKAFEYLDGNAVGKPIKPIDPIELENTITPQIIGGTTTQRGEFPEFVQVWLDGGDGLLYAVCGGSLIANNKVLTAGHCSLELTNLYYVTPNFYTFSDSLTAANTFQISSKARHTKYNNSTLDYDMAIFTLAQNIGTAKASVYGGSNQLNGLTSTVIGTGLTNSNTGALPNTLQKVNTPIVTNAACNAVYVDNITSRMVCAGFSGNGLGACSGDSGGPLWATISSTRVQVGVVSFGPQTCETTGVYSGYARTSNTELVSFIRAQSPSTIVMVDPAPPPTAPGNSSIIPILQLLLLDD